ncbi:MAG: aspartate--tRNA ligase [bacterium]
MTLSAASQRTHYAADCNPDRAGQTVILAGWVHRLRDLGGVVFLELRDATGLVQVVCNEGIDSAALETAHGLREESVVMIEGTIAVRPTGQENADWASGAVDVKGEGLMLLNLADPLPVMVNHDGGESQERLFKYRYLQLRRPDARKRILLRHHVMQDTRAYFFARDFHEIETPILCKGTPEGSREYLVPYRAEPGMFYVLPQSPQQFKQLLVTAGFERYFQIARCFRDEDLRANRQPEFTQLDLEWAFPTQEEILTTIEGWMALLWEKHLGITLPVPFPRIPYRTAINEFGVDKPDMRFGLRLEDLQAVFTETQLKVFRGTLDAGGHILGIRLPGTTFSRSETSHWEERAKALGAAGLAHIVREGDGLRSPLAKHLSESETAWFLKALNDGDTMFILAHSGENAHAILGALRLELAKHLALIPANAWAPCFVVDFPLFEKNNEGGVSAVHHPFTMPHMDQWNALIAQLGHEPTLSDGDPLLTLGSQTHDLVMNGEELASGSIRIANPNLQWQIFRCLGIPEETIQARFGHMLEAFRYGAPPHGGIAPGMDRLIAMLAGEEAITSVIAFPKTLKGHDLLMGAPSPMPVATLTEVGIRVLEPPQKTTVVAPPASAIP